MSRLLYSWKTSKARLKVQEEIGHNRPVLAQKGLPVGDLITENGGATWAR